MPVRGDRPLPGHHGGNRGRPRHGITPGRSPLWSVVRARAGMGSGEGIVRCAAVHLWHGRVVVGGDGPGRAARHRSGYLFGGGRSLSRSIARGISDRAARRGAERGVRPLGHLRVGALPPSVGAARSGQHLGMAPALHGPSLWCGNARSRTDPLGHDRAVHRHRGTRSSAGRAEYPARSRPRPGRHGLGDDEDRRAPLWPLRPHRRRAARPGAGPRGDDGGHHGHRQSAGDLSVSVRTRLHDGQRTGQRVHGSDVGPLSLRSRGDRSPPPRRDRARQCVGAATRLDGGGRGEGDSRVSVATRRFLVNRVMGILCGTAAALVILPLILVFAFLLYQGGSSINLEFFTHTPKPVGEPGGGMANAIVGTLILIGLACGLGLPVGILGGLYVADSQDAHLPSVVRFLADVLNGVPSIVIGIFAYTLVVLPMKRFSALAGGVALGVIMIPIVLRTTEEIVRLVPASLREAGLALGLPKWKVTVRIVITTGVMVAIARIAGETAPLLFTAFGNRFWHHGLDQPIAALAIQIFAYAISPFDDWHRQAWAGALVLISIVFLVSLAARLATRDLQRQMR